MSIYREWIKTIQSTSKLLHALTRGLEIPTSRIRSRSTAPPTIVHETMRSPVMSYKGTIADIEWKKSQAYLFQARNSVR